MSQLHMIILSIIEGLTEFLPISSTGHMIVASALLGINENQFTKDFTVVVQFGAIMSVLVLYWPRFLNGWSLYKKLFVAFLPAAVIGLAVKNKIDAILGDVHIVAIALIVGGIVLLFVDRSFAQQEAALEKSDTGKNENLTYVESFIIGCAQCLAFIPGMSRSAMTIIGGLGVKLTRKSAAEFSFLLAVPTLSAATAMKLLKMGPELHGENLKILLIGNLISFFVGMLTIKTFLGFLTRRGFFAFGVYRIILGGLILALLSAGYSMDLL